MARIGTTSDLLRLLPSFYGEKPKNITALFDAVTSELVTLGERYEQMRNEFSVDSCLDQDLERVFGVPLGISRTPTNTPYYRELLYIVWHGVNSTPTPDRLRHIIADAFNIKYPNVMYVVETNFCIEIKIESNDLTFVQHLHEIMLNYSRLFLPKGIAYKDTTGSLLRELTDAIDIQLKLDDPTGLGLDRDPNIEHDPTKYRVLK